MTVEFRPAFEKFVAPARERNEVWRLLLGLCLISITFIAWVMGLVFAYGYLVNSGNPAAGADGLIEAKTPQDVLLVFTTFIGMALGPILIVRFLHKRPIRSLFGANCAHDFLFATAITSVIYGAGVVLWFLVYDGVPNLALSTWLLFLPLATLGLLIQTVAEELIFRGYLQQQLAARFGSFIVWLILPSLLFGAAHYDPETAGENVWLIVLTTTVFGLVAADLTARTGSIGTAWGLHFANNFFAVLFISIDGTIPGLALYITPYNAEDPILRTLIWLDIGALILTWAVLRRLMSR